MKIDPVTYEVSLQEDGLRPIYVWEAPVRAWHWLMALAMAVMIPTGWLIGSPLEANLGETWRTYQLAHIRLAHCLAGFAFTGLFAYRLFWAIAGNRYARQIFAPPVWSRRFLKGVADQALYYLFLRKSTPEYAAHNPLAALAMAAIFVPASLGAIATGLALYGQAFGAGTGWELATGWMLPLMGGGQSARTAHHALMPVFGLFILTHVYMAVREDIMGGATEMSAITSGLRLFKRAGLARGAAAKGGRGHDGA